MEWTDTERDFAMAWVEYERDKCGGCGDQLSETTLPENEFAYVGSARRCHRCTALDIAQKKVTSDREYPHPHALVWYVEKR